jgi:hypothetical protein
MVCTVFQVSGTTEKWSWDVQIISEIVRFQRSQNETAHICVGYDIGIIDEYETRADTVQILVIQCTML